jgi:hypothetical protein
MNQSLAQASDRGSMTEDGETMGDNKEQKFAVEIEKSKYDTKIRVVGISLGADKAQFDCAYKLVDELYKRVSNLDAAIKLDLERAVRDAKAKAATLWIREGDQLGISKTVSENSHRIALSLLQAYPECKKQLVVVTETQLTKQSVSNHLRGYIKSTQLYFEQCEDGNRLSLDGLHWVITEIIPAVVKK